MSGSVRLRDGFTGVDLHQLAKSRIDPGQIRHFLTLAAVYDGMKRSNAAVIDGMDRLALFDRGRWFNEEGSDCLINRKGPKRVRRINVNPLNEMPGPNI